MINIFTSITTNYLPKARVLAQSVKRLHPEVTFHLVLADRRPGPDYPGMGCFDRVWTLEDLEIPNVRAWAFEHSVVELCTAVKGPAARRLLEAHGGDLFYFDPDIVVLAPIDPLLERLAQNPILLTPHLTNPEESLSAIVDNEICALKHGVFNLGFLGLRDSEAARQFARWWEHRLLHFCYDDIPRGLFTDQRWLDLAPCFFPELGVLREPQFNVATWNLAQRRVTGAAPYGLEIEGKPVVFYHFSGFDSGAQKGMLKRYGRHSPALFDLRQWYIDQCRRNEHNRESRRPCIWGLFDDGTPVEKPQRLAYRSRPDLKKAFPDPYLTTDPNRSYLHWWRRRMGSGAIRRWLAPANFVLRQTARAARALKRRVTANLTSD